MAVATGTRKIFHIEMEGVIADFESIQRRCGATSRARRCGGGTFTDRPAVNAYSKERA